VNFLKKVQDKLSPKRSESPPETPAQPGPTIDQVAPSAESPKSGALDRVKSLIAVGSGKGGVGKSTVSLNLALALQQQGKKVGLIDADIYGPSQQHMTRAARPTLMDGDFIEPSTYEGIKLISIAMFSNSGQAQLLRGPMAAQVIRQFLSQVAWGELDYLLIDLPPGTGDIQLTLAQIAPLSGAVLVTTPQEISLIDVRKAVAMFQTLNVPILGVVENMSYFICDNCEKKHYIFQQSGGKKLSAECGAPLLAEIPIDPRVAESSDQGRPVFVQHPSSIVGQAYVQIAEKVVAQEQMQRGSDGALGYFLLEWK
jgi:ATP-binding protein involved in chromosome partitioning